MRLSQKQKQEYLRNGAIASLTINNNYGYLCYDVINEIDTYLVIALVGNDTNIRMRAYKVYYNLDGTSFVLLNGLRYNVNDFIRV